MRNLKGISLFVAAAIVAVPQVFAEEKKDSDFVDGKITKNVDGDTVWVESDRRNNARRVRLKIRMLGIDAPETHLPTPEGVVGQGHWGEDASRAMARLLPLNTIVEVEDEGQDHFGRTLGRVFRHEEDANLKMLNTGWAIPYIICEGPRCKQDFFEKENVGGYLEACDDARSARVGIFDRSSPLKEMPFEFRLRMQNRKPDKYVGDFETKELYKPADYKKVDLCKRIFFMKLAEAKRAGFNPVFRENE